MLIAKIVTNFSSLTNKWIYYFFLTQVDFTLNLPLMSVPMTGEIGLAIVFLGKEDLNSIH